MYVLWARATGEMELSGTNLELLRLAEDLRMSRADCCLDPSGDPVPYSMALSLIRVSQTSGEVSISVSSDRENLQIEGAAEALEILASTLEEFAADGDRTAHLHIEPLPGHEFLSGKSEPLVVTLVE